MGKRGTSAKIQAISGSIQRISLSFAGGPVAVQVSGDPDPANNGLFYIYADHLGSSGSLSDSSGVYIPNSHAKYTPFGDWRTEPTATAGDRYYTNHKHNNLGNGADDLGLIYMNARYYLPGVGRFASADTVVPNAANPQSYNRYSYVLNSPIMKNDPTGHDAEIDDAGYYPDWWFDEEIRRIYVEGYGVFDKEHIERGYNTAEYIFAQLRDAVENGGTEFTLRSGANFDKKYKISGDISEDDFVGIALGIYMDFELSYESFQVGGGKGFFNRFSGFAPEDLPSNYIGFWAYASGKSIDEIPAILRSLGEVSVHNSILGDRGGSLVFNRTRYQQIDPLDAGTSFYLSVPRNYSFDPMAPRVDGEGVHWENVPWPEELQLTPIGSGKSTWQVSD